jgi:sodium transport system permease protein
MVMALALTAFARDRGVETPLTVAVDGEGRAAGLMACLAERSVTVEPAPVDAAERIAARALPVALVIGSTYGEDFRESRPAEVTLLYDGAWTASSRAAARLRDMLAEYTRRVADTRLVLRGVSPSATAALRVTEQDFSTAAGRAAAVLATLPIFVLIAAFIGGMGLAADLMAGERERASLESLRLHPVAPAQIVVGKWAAASVVCLLTVSLTIAACQAVLQHPRIQAIDLPIGLSAGEAVRMWLTLVPLALLATAVQLLVALFARTYKEAQTHLSLLLFLPMLPGFLFAFGSLDIRAWLHWVPMLGQQIALGDVLRGLAPAPGPALASAAVTAAAAVVTLAVTSHLLARESMVRRSAG